MLSIAAVVSLIAAATAQQIGTQTAETHPSLTWSTCTSSGCTQVAGSIVLDANWRWVHEVGTTTNCYTGNKWDTSICTSPQVCASQCALDGASYQSTYGISTSGNAVTLDFVTENSSGANVGSRVYLLNSNTEYETFNLLNHEFTFTVDASQLPCGLNGAVYFSQMDADGGMARFPTNKAGAQYGTGYCDSQCPRDIKFIDGVANILNWNSTNANSGTGSLGTCCGEMDIWEANQYAEAVTPHPCTVTQQTSCTGTECSGTLTTGYCDPAGCDFNPYRQGNPNFYGPGLTIDSTSPVTVVTQFITDDGTDTGTLTAIKRYYVQGGKAYAQPAATNIGLSTNEIDTAYCNAQKTAFGDTNIFAAKGGLAQMGASLDAMVLVLSLWDDTTAYMLWLDSDYPVGQSTSQPGTVRGPCATNSGIPATVESQYPSAKVVYSDIRYGTLNSTWSGVVGTTSTTSTSKSSTPTSKSSTPTTQSTTTTTAGGSCATLYGQCGGIGWNGPTCCSSGTCKVGNPYYSQCLS